MNQKALTPSFDPKRHGIILLVILAQFFCAIFFIADAITDVIDLGKAYELSLHLVVEIVAVILLIVAIWLEIRQLVELIRRKEHLEENLRQSQQSLHEVIQEHFHSWKLSPAEHEVAMFLIKGLDIGEIALIRNTSEGTVKAQLSSVYRKAGVKNRGELLSGIIDTIYTV